MTDTDKAEDYSPYYTDHGAAVGLLEGLRELRKIEKLAAGYWDGLPWHLTQERDHATANVKAALRYLLTD